MRHILLTISYDGSEFCGWQRQKHCIAVESLVEWALQSLLGENVVLLGSSRTDAQVHAKNQKASFSTTDTKIPSWKFAPALNSQLPKSIRILNSILVNLSFHPRYCARYRTYQYYFKEQNLIYPWEQAYVYGIRFSPCLNELNNLATVFLGKQDFTSFCACQDASPSKVREIYQAFFTHKNGTFIFTITANAFLWTMVRSIIGTLLYASQHQKDKTWLKAVLLAQNRTRLPQMAPAYALYLNYVSYQKFNLLLFA